MSIFRFSVGSDAKSMAVPCVFAIGVVCWANSTIFLLTVHTSSTAQGGGGSFKNRKPIGEIDCCESPMTEQKH